MQSSVPNGTATHHDLDALMGRLEALALDQPGVALTFTRRLARENDWSAAFAEQVVAEYRRFLYLAVRAGHPVSPSDAVDQAWHLHLVYTESYWNDLCRDILGRPLHHGPTRGGRQESEKIADWYEQTLASYRRIFGKLPPENVWPGCSERFADAAHFRRINTRRHWIVSKPKWMRRGSTRVRARSSARRGPPMLVGFLLAGAVMLAGCAVTGLGAVNIFDWRADLFLGFYVLLGVLLVSAAIPMRLRMFGSRPTPTTTIAISPNIYSIAYLAGDNEAAARAALVSLCERGMLTITSDEPGVPVRLAASTDPARVASLDPLEQRVLRRIYGVESTADLTHRLEPVTRSLGDELVARGLLTPPAQRRRLRQWGALFVGIALAVGIVKMVVGLSRAHPIEDLFLLTIGLTGALAYLTLRPPRLTWSGQAVLSALRTKYLRFTTRSLHRLRTGMHGDEPDGDTFAGLIPLLVGLYGTRAWGVTAEANPYSGLIPGGGDAGGGCISGGGGDAGGGGDGGCGGGCGGCGGD